MILISQQARGRDLGGELESDGPPGLTAYGAQPLLKVEPVDLDHDAVDLVVDGVAPLFPGLAIFDDRRKMGMGPVMRIDGKPPPNQLLENLSLGIEPQSFRMAQGVGEKRQGPGRGHGGVELPQGSGGRISRVGEGRRPFLRSLPVDPFKPRQRKIDFSPDLGSGRVGSLPESKGQGSDGPEIRRHVLSLQTVSPGGSVMQAAVFVGQGDRYSVDLELGHQADLLDLQLSRDPAVEGLQLDFIEGVGQTQHGHSMSDFSGIDPAARRPLSRVGESTEIKSGCRSSSSTSSRYRRSNSGSEMVGSPST